MNRREALAATTGLAALSYSTLAQAVTPKANSAKEGLSAENQALYAAAVECVRVGEECLDHCLRLMSVGNKSVADCAARVRAMLPTCRALIELARLDSTHLKAMAALCAQVCRDCEAACKVHASHHAECKACMEACQKCAAECEKKAA